MPPCTTVQLQGVTQSHYPSRITGCHSQIYDFPNMGKDNNQVATAGRLWRANKCASTRVRPLCKRPIHIEVTKHKEVELLRSQAQPQVQKDNTVDTVEPPPQSQINIQPAAASQPPSQQVQTQPAAAPQPSQTSAEIPASQGSTTQPDTAAPQANALQDDPNTQEDSKVEEKKEMEITEAATALTEMIEKVSGDDTESDK